MHAPLPCPNNLIYHDNEVWQACLVHLHAPLIITITIIAVGAYTHVHCAWSQAEDDRIGEHLLSAGYK